jgi:O-antigen/teichoic acid export membrane protein
MEENLNSALERIDNPILIILLVALLVAIVFLWRAYQHAQQRMYALAVETVGSLKDLTARLESIDDRLDNITTP